MALIIADRVKETATTTGTGAFTLAGAQTGFRTFAAVCATNDTCYYAIQGVDGAGIPTSEWEVGLGTYSSANTLTRTTVLASSNAGAAVNFSAGTKQVWIDLAASDLANIRNGAAKAWVYFTNGGTPALGASFNVSSLTDNGAGLTTINLTTAMVDSNWSAVATYSSGGDTALGRLAWIRTSGRSSSAVPVGTENTGTTMVDVPVSCVVFR